MQTCPLGFRDKIKAVEKHENGDLRANFLKSHQLGSRRSRVARRVVVSVVVVFIFFILLDLLVASLHSFSLFCTNKSTKQLKVQ